MLNTKNEFNSSSPNNSLNAFNSEFKAILKVELNVMKKDLLFFKDDILKDIRKIEEKLNLKINQQNTLISDQYDAFQEKAESHFRCLWKTGQDRKRSLHGEYADKSGRYCGRDQETQGRQGRENPGKAQGKSKRKTGTCRHLTEKGRI